jgi:serine protease Do
VIKRIIASLALLIFASSASPLLNELSDAFSQIAAEATPAVVFIEIEGYPPHRTQDAFSAFVDPWLRRLFDLPQPTEPSEYDALEILGHGSGFLVSSDGYIVTNNHIVHEADRLLVRLDDGRQFEAIVIGADSKTDLAVIKIEASDLPYLQLGRSSELRTGQFVVAIGSPFGLGGTLTHGIVSATNRDNLRITDFEDFIQTDAPINPGNSGGPLLNLQGEVIGVNTAIITTEDGGANVGIGLAIPSDMVRYVIEQLISVGVVRRGYLGVALQQLTPDLASAFEPIEMSGVIITDVYEDSPAEEAGLQPDDIVVECNGQPIETVAELRNLMARTQPNDPLSLGVIRYGERIDLMAFLADPPKNYPSGAEIAKKIGIEVIQLTESLRQALDYPLLTGVVVSAVRSRSLAASAGIRPGMLIQRVDQWEIYTPAEFAAQLEQSARQNQFVVFKIRAGGRTHFISIKLR